MSGPWPFVRTMIDLDEVDSTSDRAARMVQGADIPLPLCVWARRQTPRPGQGGSHVVVGSGQPDLHAGPRSRRTRPDAGVRPEARAGDRGRRDRRDRGPGIRASLARHPMAERRAGWPVEAGRHPPRARGDRAGTTPPDRRGAERDDRSRRHARRGARHGDQPGRDRGDCDRGRAPIATALGDSGSSRIEAGATRRSGPRAFRSLE